MFIPEAVKDWESAPQNSGENTVKTFEEKAEEILNTLKWDIIPKEEVSEKKVEEVSKVESKEEKKVDEPKKEEENKIPLSRLNKEIDKRKDLEEEINLIKEKLSKEQERVKALSEEEKEEQEMYKRLWLETKEDKLFEKIEELERNLSKKSDIIKSYEEEINKSSLEKLTSRISELTEKHNWTDWLPKFDISELIKFWNEENYMPPDPIKLYNLKYQNEILAKKYKEKAPEVDKGNKESFTPVKKKLSWFEDPDFETEALAILNINK